MYVGIVHVLAHVDWSDLSLPPRNTCSCHMLFIYLKFIINIILVHVGYQLHQYDNVKIMLSVSICWVVSIWLN